MKFAWLFFRHTKNLITFITYLSFALEKKLFYVEFLKVNISLLCSDALQSINYLFVLQFISSFFNYMIEFIFLSVVHFLGIDFQYDCSNCASAEVKLFVLFYITRKKENKLTLFRFSFYNKLMFVLFRKGKALLT